VQAITHGHRRVRFFSTIELVNALEQEKAADSQASDVGGMALRSHTATTNTHLNARKT
jgi:hypothetical protein